MTLVVRLLRLAVGLVFAIPSGAAALGLAAMLDPTLRALAGSLGFVGLDALLDEAPERAAGLLAALAAGLFSILAVPPTLAALVGGVLGWRSATAYGLAPGLLTALVPWVVQGLALRGGLGVPSAGEGRVTALLFLAGGVAGLVLGLFGRTGAPRGLSAPRP